MSYKTRFGVNVEGVGAQGEVGVNVGFKGRRGVWCQCRYEREKGSRGNFDGNFLVSKRKCLQQCLIVSLFVIRFGTLRHNFYRKKPVLSKVESRS